MSTPGFSSRSLAEAVRAVQRTQAYKAGRTEQFLNMMGKHAFHCVLCLMPSARHSPSVLGDRALALSGGDAVLAIQNVAASAAFNSVKEQVNHFAEHSKMLVRALDEVSKAHPFILSTHSHLCVYYCRVLIYIV